MDNLQKVIAIDGPSGSGKSTLAKELASQLDLVYIDTGAMFRALAYYAHQKEVPLDDAKALAPFLEGLEIEYGVSAEVLIVINGEDLTKKIREHQVSKLASIISQVAPVRTFLLDLQRRLVNNHFCVMEGRDIGTVVFPNAFCKFYISASLEIRAQRRLNQLKAQGQEVDLETVKKDVLKRDESDINRVSAPLRQADDAIYLDTTGMNLNEVLERLKKEVRQRAELMGQKL